jgi:hypothetical protein
VSEMEQKLFIVSYAVNALDVQEAWQIFCNKMETGNFVNSDFVVKECQD